MLSLLYLTTYFLLLHHHTYTISCPFSFPSLALESNYWEMLWASVCLGYLGYLYAFVSILVPLILCVIHLSFPHVLWEDDGEKREREGKREKRKCGCVLSLSPFRRPLYLIANNEDGSLLYVHGHVLYMESPCVGVLSSFPLGLLLLLLLFTHQPVYLPKYFSRIILSLLYHSSSSSSFPSPF